MSMNILPACDVRHSQRLEEGGMVVRHRVGARHGTRPSSRTVFLISEAPLQAPPFFPPFNSALESLELS